MGGAAAPIVGGAIGAGGSILGGQAAKPDPVDPYGSYYNPLTDPTLAGLSMEAMIGLGLPPSLIMQQASPLNQLINAINMDPTIKASAKANITKELRKAVSGADIVNIDKDIQGRRRRDKILNQFLPFTSKLTDALGIGDKLGAGQASESHIARALFTMGYTGDVEDILVDFLSKEAEWQEFSQGALGEVGAGQEDIFGARLATQQSIGNLMGELAGQYGGGQPGATAGNFMRNLEADINTTYDERLEDVMRMAGSAGYNPGRALSDLERDRATALRNLPMTGAMQAGQIIALMQGTLNPAQQLSAQTAGLRTGQNVAASTSAGNQASVINQIQGTINSQRAQAAGAGISGAGSNMMNALYLNNLRGQSDPATGGNPNLTVPNYNRPDFFDPYAWSG